MPMRARRWAPDRIVGVTCHDLVDLAIEAAEAGADYVAFGAFFPTGTKAAKTQASPELLRQWSDVTTVPCVAIGGITADNCGDAGRGGGRFPGGGRRRLGPSGRARRRRSRPSMRRFRAIRDD